MQRRNWLKLGLASATLFGIGGASLLLLTPAADTGRLTPSARGVLRSCSFALLDGILPAAGDAANGSVEALMQRIDALVSALPVHAQEELATLLALLATSAGRRIVTTLRSDWESASLAEIHVALQAMRSSSLSLRQQAYHALHDIVLGAYFADESTWQFLGYPGPLKV